MRAGMRRFVPLLLALPAPLAAQALPGEIVVTGAALPQPAGEAAYDVATIDRARLTTSASGRLEDVLRDVAGFAQFRRSDSRSAQPTSQGATLRGLGGNASSRALVTLDGVPLTDPFGGWVNFTAVDPERLGLVRVTRGGGSGVSGPGALAGTIALTSAGPLDMPPAWGEVRYGSRDSVDARAGVSGVMGGGYGFLTASYAEGDGFVPIVRSARGPVDEASPYRQASVAGRAVIPVGPDMELQGSALVFADRRTRGTVFTPNRTNGEDGSLRLVGHGRWGFELLGYVQARTFSAGFASINDARTTATQVLDQYDVPSTAVGGRFELRPPVGERIELRIGADARRTSGETDELYSYVAGAATRRREAGGDTLTVGGFAEASLKPSDALTFTAGGRIDRWRISDGFLDQTVLATQQAVTATRYPTRTGWRPTGRGGVAWRPADGPVTVRGAAYLGWRLPTLNELYRLYRVGADAVGANADLKPERLKGVDGGIDYDPLPNLHLAATVFANRLEDAIANVTVASGPGTFPDVGFVSAAGRYQMRQNVDAVRSRGVELDARLALARWRLSASYAFADARVRASGAAAALDGLRPAQTAKHQASATLGWVHPAGIAADLTLRYIGRQYEDDLNTETLDDAVTLDASVRLPLTHGFQLELAAENLTDALVPATISGEVIERATPRTLWIGLRYAVPKRNANNSAG